ncbi:hypothetical protein [Paenibacillus sp. OSY-SE]|uniref:hypothetical protein n=1 Tax=Paenibacillus sp. OSY-SE TaxID=1196323 RepID=UPI000315BB33|nr:hypothetical protein [Paenibacillus sp. OSY-SE]
MGIWTGVKNMVMKLLRINPAPENRIITITEPFSHQTNVLRNRLWYRGDPSELDQFYKQTALEPVSKSRFWAAVPSADLSIRKIHSGLPAMVAERLSDIVIADMDGEWNVYEELYTQRNVALMLQSTPRQRTIAAILTLQRQGGTVE